MATTKDVLTLSLKKDDLFMSAFPYRLLFGIIDFSKQLSIYTGNAIYESAKNINQTFMKS